MTLPDDVHQLPTLAAHLDAAGDPVAEAYQCPTCPRVVPAEGLVDMAVVGVSPPRWVCHVCASGPFRIAAAAEAAAAREAAGPDWSAVRAQRDGLLTRCDWTQVPDAPLDEPTRDAWRDYRQQLRDVTEDFATPEAVVWPTPPA